MSSTFSLNYAYSTALTFNLKNALGEPLEVIDPHTVALVINHTLTWERVYSPTSVLNTNGVYTLPVITPSPESINTSAVLKLPTHGLVPYFLELRHPSNIAVLLLAGTINIIHP